MGGCNGRRSIGTRAVRLLLILLLAGGPLAGGSVLAGPAQAIDWAALARRYTERVAQNPDDADARFTLGVIQAHGGRFPEALENLRWTERLVGERGRPAFARRTMAAANLRLGAQPQDVLALYKLAFAAYFINEKNVTVQAMLRAASLEPDHVWTAGYVGFLYAERGRLDEGIAWWERGLRMDPKNPVLHYMLGLAYSRKGDMKKAAAHFAAAYRDRTLYEYITGRRRA